MVVDFNDARLKHQFKRFRETGEIPEYIYAGGIPGNSGQLYLWASTLCITEARSEYSHLIGIFSTLSSKFCLPYTLSKYRKGINPITALFQELQSALFKDSKSRNKFEEWIILFCKEHCAEIIVALINDIELINQYIKKYTKAGRRYIPSLLIVLENFKSYLYVFSNLN